MLDDDVDQYIESCIIFGGQLTNLGLDMYSMETYIVDEDGNEVMVNNKVYSAEE